MTSKSKGKEICDESMVDDDTDRPSTSNVCDIDHLSIKDSQTDSSDDESEDEVSNNSETEKHVSNKTINKQIVVDQVFTDTENFEKVLLKKSAHFVETNTVAYPNFKCSDDVVYHNQVFITTRNVENISELNIMVEEDNKKTSEE